MGEMISMIAHQWRQPLSTVTLSVSNMQVKQMLGQKIEPELLDKSLKGPVKEPVYKGWLLEIPKQGALPT